MGIAILAAIEKVKTRQLAEYTQAMLALASNH